MFNAMILRRPEHGSFEWWKNAVLSLLRKSADPNHKIYMAWSLAIYNYWTGNVANTTLFAEMLHGSSASGLVTPLIFIYGKTAEATSFLANAMFKEASKAINEGLETARTTDIHLWDLHLLSFGVATAIGAKDLKRARALLE